MAGDARRASGGRLAATVAVSDGEMAEVEAEAEAERESESGSDSVSLSPDPTHRRHLALEKQELAWDFVAVAQLECLQLLHVMPATAGHTRKQAHAAAFNDVGLKRAAYFVNGTSRCVGPA